MCALSHFCPTLLQVLEQTKADPGRERKLVKRFKVDLTPPPQGLNAPEPGSTEKSVQADQSMNYRKGISKYTGFKGTI